MLYEFFSCQALNTWPGEGLGAWGRALVRIPSGEPAYYHFGIHSFIHSFTSLNKHLWGFPSGLGPGLGSEDTMNGGLGPPLSSQSSLSMGEVRLWNKQFQHPTTNGVAQGLRGPPVHWVPTGTLYHFRLKPSHLSNGESPWDLFRRALMRHERVFIVKNFIVEKSVRHITLRAHLVDAGHLPILQMRKLRLRALQNCCLESGRRLRTWRNPGDFQDLPLRDTNSQFVSKHLTSLDQTWGHDARTHSSGSMEMSP